MINKYGENIHESIYKSQGNKNQPRQIKEEELHQKKHPPVAKISRCLRVQDITEGDLKGTK